MTAASIIVQVGLVFSIFSVVLNIVQAFVVIPHSSSGSPTSTTPGTIAYLALRTPSRKGTQLFAIGENWPKDFAKFLDRLDTRVITENKELALLVDKLDQAGERVKEAIEERIKQIQEAYIDDPIPGTAPFIKSPSASPSAPSSPSKVTTTEAPPTSLSKPAQAQSSLSGDSSPAAATAPSTTSGGDASASVNSAAGTASASKTSDLESAVEQVKETVAEIEKELEKTGGGGDDATSTAASQAGSAVSSAVTELEEAVADLEKAVETDLANKPPSGSSSAAVDAANKKVEDLLNKGESELEKGINDIEKALLQTKESATTTTTAPSIPPQTPVSLTTTTPPSTVPSVVPEMDTASMATTSTATTAVEHAGTTTHPMVVMGSHAPPESVHDVVVAVSASTHYNSDYSMDGFSAVPSLVSSPSSSTPWETTYDAVLQGAKHAAWEVAATAAAASSGDMIVGGDPTAATVASTIIDTLSTTLL